MERSSKLNCLPFALMRTTELLYYYFPISDVIRFSVLFFWLLLVFCLFDMSKFNYAVFFCISARFFII